MAAARVARIMMGQVLKKGSDPKHLLVRCQHMELDESLLMYFPEQVEKWTMDYKGEARMKDIVLIKPAGQKLTPEIDYVLDSVVFKQGAIIDPVTGRLCRGTEYVDVTKREEELSRRDTTTLSFTKIKQEDETVTKDSR